MKLCLKILTKIVDELIKAVYICSFFLEPESVYPDK